MTTILRYLSYYFYSIKWQLKLYKTRLKYFKPQLNLPYHITIEISKGSERSTWVKFSHIPTRERAMLYLSKPLHPMHPLHRMHRMHPDAATINLPK